MTKNKQLRTTMRVLHRYLGFFLAGIMAVYALSGTVLIFRDTDFLKQEKRVVKQIKANASPEEVGRMLGIRGFKVDKEENGVLYFESGSYDKTTGEADYVLKALPSGLEKMTHLHKAKSSDPLFFLNIFFGISLLFFVISAFWMFMPKATVFVKGLYFAGGGALLTILLLFL